jgi:hypothetical protein
MIALAGLFTLLAALHILYVFRMPAGQTSRRSEWLDSALALAFTSAVGGGIAMVGAGLLSLFY